MIKRFLLCAGLLALGSPLLTAQDVPLNIPTTPPPPDADNSGHRDIMPVHPIVPIHAASAIQPPKEIADKIDVFFKSLKTGSYSSAYDVFLENTRLGSQKDKMSVFVSRTEAAFGIYGQMNDYELYDNYPIGHNVIVLTYLTRHSIQPLRWRFIYYRADSTWTVINMGFDDNLLELLD